MKLPKEFSLKEIAGLLGGRVEGNGDTKIGAIALHPSQAKEGEIAFIFDPKYAATLQECKASAVLVPEGVETTHPRIVVQRPLLAVQKVLSALQPKRYIADGGVHPSAVVDPTAELGPGVDVGPLAVIGPKTKVGARTKIGAGCLIGGEVTIGEDCLFHQGAMVADYVQIGKKVILQQGASIGADGFSYVTDRPSNMELRMAGIHELSDEPNPHRKIPNVGNVILEDYVEIGSNASVNRATMGSTVIGKGTKIDDLVMIAHNCRLGSEVLVIGGSVMGGSCTVGDRAIIAGQCAIADHIKIGKDAILQGRTGTMQNIEEKAVVAGGPAVPYRQFFVNAANVNRLGKFFSDVKALQRKVAEMEKMMANSTPLEKVK